MGRGFIRGQIVSDKGLQKVIVLPHGHPVKPLKESDIDKYLEEMHPRTPGNVSYVKTPPGVKEISKGFFYKGKSIFSKSSIQHRLFHARGIKHAHLQSGSAANPKEVTEESFHGGHKVLKYVKQLGKRVPTLSGAKLVKRRFHNVPGHSWVERTKGIKEHRDPFSDSFKGVKKQKVEKV